VTIERSTVGPNVSLERGTKITDSTLANAIVGRDTTLRNVSLDGALIGNSVLVEGLTGSVTLGDHSEVAAGQHS
jgi:glucose-1-phosphate thymidylyltransferase